MDFNRFPRRSYLNGPTPIEPMPALARALGTDLNLYIKRDDLLPGAGGGNKTRKLEFCMAEALEQGADTVVTCGAVQSNHCRLTASWAAKEGLECHLVLEERVEGSYHPDASGNNFLFELLDVRSIKVVEGGSDMDAAMADRAATLSQRGRTPYIIPGGASNAVGATGYAACARETEDQLTAMGLDIGHIVLPSGSAGTHAGMLAGLTGISAHIPVTGINVSRDKEAQEKLVFGLARETAERLEIAAPILKESVVCEADYVGPGYSLPTDAMVEAVKLFAKTEAILLDPVYSGKAAAGFLDLIRRGRFDHLESILFLHTGGAPALFAYMDTFRQ